MKHFRDPGNLYYSSAVVAYNDTPFQQTAHLMKQRLGKDKVYVVSFWRVTPCRLLAEYQRQADTNVSTLPIRRWSIANSRNILCI